MKIFLVPTDFSAYAQKALFFALDLAHKTGARILVVHVYQQPQALLGTAGNPDARQHALERMESFLSQINRDAYPSVPLDFILKEGNILTRLSQLVEQNKVSLVIMGTKGAHNQLERILGTHTQALAKRGLCPVIAVPANASLQPVQHIVYSSSFEHDEVAAMGQLLQFKKVFDARLTILHVDSEEQLDLLDDSEIKNNLRLRYPEEGFRFEVIEEEDVAAGIAAFVRTHPTDLLAFTMLQRDFWERIFLDSVTSELLQKLHLPMLVLPENAPGLDLQQTVAHEDQALDRKLH